MRPPMPWIARGLIAASIGLLTLACSGGGPKVITSTRDKVAIQFPKKGSLQETGKMADEECSKIGRTAEFDEVDPTATPDTRIAKYRCVDR